MGLFLSMSSIVGAISAEVQACMAEYAATRRGIFEPASATTHEHQIARLTESSSGITLIYPDHFLEWDEVSAFLSLKLRKPVFSFHIHDGDFWMFILYVNGAESLKFNPIPDYFEELQPYERAQWLPTGEQVVQFVPNIRPERLAPYLIEWTDDGLEGTAHPEDSSGFVDWQVTDFMRELGFAFCELDDPNCHAFRFDMKARR
jgi:hypothetical protein